MSKAIPVYMPKFEPSKPSCSHHGTSHRTKEEIQKDPLNLKMKPVVEIADDSSYVCATTDENRNQRGTTDMMQTEGNSYIGVPINQEALDISFEAGNASGLNHLYHNTETKRNEKKKAKLPKHLMTLNSPTREERNLNIPTENYMNPFTSQGTCETEPRMTTENNENMMIRSDGNLEEEGEASNKRKFKLSFRANERLCFFFYLVFAVTVSVGSVYLSTTWVNLVDSPYCTNSIIALLTVGLTNFIFQKSIFMKKSPKVFNLMGQRPLNLSIYHFPLSYYIYRVLSVACVVISVFLFTGFIGRYALYERVLGIVAASGIITYISQILFSLYYLKIYKPGLRNMQPKTFLNIPGVKNNKYNEFMDDLQNVKAHIATLRTEKDGSDNENSPPEIPSPRADQNPQDPTQKDSENTTEKTTSNQVKKKNLPSMVMKHVLGGNIILFSFAASLMITLMVPLTVHKKFNSSRPPASAFTLWGLFSGPVVYIGLSIISEKILKRLKFQAEMMIDVLLFLGIIGAYKAVFLVYPYTRAEELLDLVLFSGGKMLWKYVIYFYKLYQLRPIEGEQSVVYKKKQTETGEVIELFKRSHINFGMKVWFWQYCDIALSIAYLVLLPLITMQSVNQFSHVRHYKPILNSMLTLIGDAVLEICGLLLVKYLFIKSNPVVKRVRFVSNLQNYTKQNLAILMLSGFFVIFISINILDITLSFL